MLLAAVGDTGYDIMLLLHILAAIVGLAPAVVDPVVAMQWSNDEPALRKFAGTMAVANQRIFGTALILAGLLGFGVAGMSDEVYKMSQGWLVAAVIVWIAMVGVLHGLLIPGGKALAAGEPGAKEKLQRVGPIFPLLTLVMLYLMVFKPGL
jgi:uncharacterized membrane protein